MYFYPLGNSIWYNLYRCSSSCSELHWFHSSCLPWNLCSSLCCRSSRCSRYVICSSQASESSNCHASIGISLIWRFSIAVDYRRSGRYNRFLLGDDNMYSLADLGRSFLGVGFICLKKRLYQPTKVTKTMLKVT